MADKKKLIIDTDCGSDDAMAIAMALNDPNYEILFMTTVSGNVAVEQATINTLTTIEYAQTYEPPVYVGSDKMLLRELVYAHETHGADGMGDIGLVPKRLKPAQGNAVIKLIEALNNSDKDEISLIVLGPLTNIALAIRLDYQAMKKAKRIVVMGTAGDGDGNVTPVAEFNIWQDAEAAKIVTESGLENIMYVGWSACLDDAMLNPQEIEKIRKGSAIGKFAIDCNKNLLEMNRERFGDDFLDMADPSAMAAALYPECIAKCAKYFCEVDVTNGPSYGNMLVDFNNVTGKAPNVYICSRLHAEKYKQYIYKTLRIEE